jgi:Polyketide cyclase / dehydrase and lipid transport
MRLLKGFLFGVAGLLAVITLFSLLIPSKVITTKAMVINAPREKITASLKDFKEWKKWNPLFAANSAQAIIGNPSAGAGATMEWGASSLKNKMTITEVFAEGIKLTLSRKNEMPVENSIVVLPLKDSLGYQVEWTAFTRLKWYPWEKFAGIFVSEITGPGYEAALKSLKSYIENPSH